MRNLTCLLLLGVGCSLLLSTIPWASEPPDEKPSASEPADTTAKPPREPAAKEPAAGTLVWQDNYAQAGEAASQQRKMLFILFSDPTNEQSNRLEAQTLADPAVRTKLQEEYVCVKLPVDAKITPMDTQEETVLLKHAAFREMLGQPGIAIVDYAHPDTPTDGTVVSQFPLTPRLWYDAAQMVVILGLPPGTLTQRTLVYAVRTHPERPASTSGEAIPRLMQEAESHAAYQARIRLQGHHRWETRFHIINSILPRGLMAREVCAESWPGQNLVEAAIECVRCWRLSAGHWNAVRAAQPCYGYDMKLGSNGVWYATGIFGCR
jgi:hypothetical protein